MEDVYSYLEKVQSQRPLVHHITNWVTIYDCANMTRCFGALPVMAHAKEEVEQMAGIAGALVLNIGTLTNELVESMILAARVANKKGIPVVLDVVGAGATDMRTLKVREILGKVRVDIIKGNAAEIGTVAGVESQVRGVESISVAQRPPVIAQMLAKERSCVVVITGRDDIVAGRDECYVISNGHEMMGKVVGTGCMAASVLGAFAATGKDYAKQCAAAMSCYGIAGEIAAKKSAGPGSFKENFYDAVYLLSAKEINAMQKISVAAMQE
ncbi:MAG TPA: hydroxyethylthiazole kinase [Candidatus Diapherotrites archaeon]|uniref:Hydroxyethylthiazole kinase n=1 Tax=Candidatus Iainarchaeum sp. TaxID=3101447 RepID=A0A7J4IVJ2_9ARCH|nr:hydroxyethylthiazole kinase [Candidatus Diapherotrites archaeon]